MLLLNSKNFYFLPVWQYLPAGPLHEIKATATIYALEGERRSDFASNP